MRSFGIPEIVVSGENGILLDPDRPAIEQLVDSMKLLAGNCDLRKTYSEHGKRHIVNNFTWERTGKIINDILSSGDAK
jgi:glycosyltransferase involved in cell wall biosynthesis